MELKIDKFRHKYASQLNIYLNYYKAEVMQPDDNPPVGILLCTEKGDTLVKYATAGLAPNIFVQKYMIELPSEEEIKSSFRLQVIRLENITGEKRRKAFLSFRQRI